MKVKLGSCVSILLLAVASRGFAFGIDKMSADLDASKGFKAIDSFVLFNDDGKSSVFVTARAYHWDMDEHNAITMTPSEDIQIYPSVQRIQPGDNATFKIRYKGPLPLKGEGNYRIVFNDIRLPTGTPQKADGTSILETTGSNIEVGIQMSVPVYVSDFSEKSDVMDHVSAHFTQQGHTVSMTVDNEGDRHVTIKGLRINGSDRPGVGPVLAHHKRVVTLDVADPVKGLSLDLSYRGQSKQIVATGGEL
ncbi:hypothetical protein WK58_09290 [Burkholderia ubonensis]|uniref:fimbrial biogenesis chaperone n=1 Tax=Burkholderia ubonensis TaxID=101571 RepID=UPI000756A977|nr:molecular chaperone [Burkholderia ubonensis]KVT78153.1 hypothetical protein WK58_09290 [Burkholderia ubonensis]